MYEPTVLRYVLPIVYRPSKWISKATINPVCYKSCDKFHEDKFNYIFCCLAK